MPPSWTCHEQDIEVTNLRIALAHMHMDIQICNAIIEGDRAQMVVQDMHLGKLQSALHGKENKKRDDHTKLFPEGKGRHLTNTEFIAQLKHVQKVKENTAVEKEGRRVSKAAKKATVAAEKEAWLKVQCKHAQAVVAWEAVKAQLIRENPKIRKKDLPLKLRAPWKTTQGGRNGIGPSKGPGAVNGHEGSSEESSEENED